MPHPLWEVAPHHQFRLRDRRMLLQIARPPVRDRIRKNSDGLLFCAMPERLRVKPPFVEPDPHCRHAVDQVAPFYQNFGTVGHRMASHEGAGY
jgi:hypothetical protein